MEKSTIRRNTAKRGQFMDFRANGQVGRTMRTGVARSRAGQMRDASVKREIRVSTAKPMRAIPQAEVNQHRAVPSARRRLVDGVVRQNTVQRVSQKRLEGYSNPDTRRVTHRAMPMQMIPAREMVSKERVTGARRVLVPRGRQERIQTVFEEPSHEIEMPIPQTQNQMQIAGGNTHSSETYKVVPGPSVKNKPRVIVPNSLYTEELLDLTEPVRKDTEEEIGFGLIEELDMRARHPQPENSSGKVLEPQSAKVTSEKFSIERVRNLATNLPWRKNKTTEAKNDNADTVNPDDDKTKAENRFKSPFLKSVTVEKRPLSSTVKAIGTGMRAATVSSAFEEGNKNDSGLATRKIIASGAKQSFPSFSGFKKEKSREVGPTVIVSQGNRLRSNIGLGIAITLTVIVGGVVGACVYLAFFQ